MSTLEDKIDKNSDKTVKKNSDGKIIFSIIAILILIVCGILIASYYDKFSKTYTKEESSATTVDNVDKKLETPTSNTAKTTTAYKLDDSSLAELEELKNIIKKQNSTIEDLQKNLEKQKKNDSVSLRLSYIIKPKNSYVAVCDTYKIGDWEIPNECVEDTISKIKNEIENDRKIVVWEVIPVVDKSPYGGLSPELKQEGLASFRAKSIVDKIYANIDGITVLKGFTIQEKNKRGYRLKAYYLE